MNILKTSVYIAPFLVGFNVLGGIHLRKRAKTKVSRFHQYLIAFCFYHSRDSVPPTKRFLVGMFIVEMIPVLNLIVTLRIFSGISIFTFDGHEYIEDEFGLLYTMASHIIDVKYGEVAYKKYKNLPKEEYLEEMVTGIVDGLGLDIKRDIKHPFAYQYRNWRDFVLCILETIAKA